MKLTRRSFIARLSAGLGALTAPYMLKGDPEPTKEIKLAGTQYLGQLWIKRKDDFAYRRVKRANVLVLNEGDCLTTQPRNFPAERATFRIIS